MVLRLKDKVVVVTGSTRGIGRAVAEACGREGAKIVICSRKKISVDAALLDMKVLGLPASGIVADVSSQKDLQKLLDHAIRTWGRVDVWINNAAVSGGYVAFSELKDDDLAGIVDVNLLGTAMACKLVVPYFLRHGGGIVINVGGKGCRGEPSVFMAAYASTKAAVACLTKSLAEENRGRSVSIHCVVPGMVATDFYKDLRMEGLAVGMPTVLKALEVPVEEVAELFVKIASQRPGKESGKVYSPTGWWRMAKGIVLAAWYGATGRARNGPFAP